MASNVLTLPPMIWIFTKGEGDGIDSRLSSKTFFTLKKVLLCLIFSVYYWIHRVSCRSVTSFCPEFFTRMPTPGLRHHRKRIEWCGYEYKIWKSTILQFSNLNGPKFVFISLGQSRLRNRCRAWEFWKKKINIRPWIK